MKNDENKSEDPNKVNPNDVVPGVVDEKSQKKAEKKIAKARQEHKEKEKDQES